MGLWKHEENHIFNLERWQRTILPEEEMMEKCVKERSTVKVRRKKKERMPLR